MAFLEKSGKWINDKTPNACIYGLIINDIWVKGTIFNFNQRFNLWRGHSVSKDTICRWWKQCHFSGLTVSCHDTCPQCVTDANWLIVSLRFIHNGIMWKTGFFKLVWRDELKSQAMLLRYLQLSDNQPLLGKGNCILLSTIKTLVPVEAHEVDIVTVLARMSSSSSVSTTKFRFALETLDGSTFMFATSCVQSRYDWLQILYSTLVMIFFSSFSSYSSS